MHYPRSMIGLRTPAGLPLHGHPERLDHMGVALPHARHENADEAAYLARLGERVRRWRQEHGVSRRALAHESQVSERYIAQLESGQGNISMLVLRRLAHAMQVRTEELVREGAGAATLDHIVHLLAALPADRLAAAHRLLRSRFGTPRTRRIALIGLRGAGKSTLGATLAAELDVAFVELDREVEREAGSELGEVFSIYGEEAFRRFERRALERVLRVNDRAVIAAGGSLVTDPDTFQLLRDECYCVWLRASPEEHMARVIAQGDLRPFRGRSAALDEIRRLLADRNELYARADAALDTAGRSPQACVRELRGLVAAAS